MIPRTENMKNVIGLTGKPRIETIDILGLVWFMVFSSTFNNISAISWRSALLILLILTRSKTKLDYFVNTSITITYMSIEVSHALTVCQ
jgi:hypothetical protein